MGNTKSKHHTQPQQQGGHGEQQQKQQKDNHGENTGNGASSQQPADESDIIRNHMGIKKAKKASLDDFDFLKTVGRGSFGKVIQVSPIRSSHAV